MARASFMQTNFLGGKWSKFFQGRVDNPNYKAAMNECRNGMPVEEGAWIRRSGTALMSPTFKGLAGRLTPLAFTSNAPYQCEWTDDGTHGYLRFYNGRFLVATEELAYLQGISTANPAVLTLQQPVAWATGDEIALIAPPGLPGSTLTQIRQRTFLVTAGAFTTPAAWSSTTQYLPGDYVSNAGVNYQCIKSSLNNTPPNTTYWTVIPAGSTDNFTLKDPISGANINGASITMGVPVSVAVVRVLRLTTPYTNSAWETLRVVQNQDLALVLQGLNAPQVLVVNQNPTSNQAANASLTAATFVDGPYLDPVPGSVATISGTSGVVGCAVAFQAFDVTKTYGLGDYVSSGGFSYQSIVGGNLGNTPPNVSFWKVVDNGLAVTGNPYADSTTYGFQASDVGRLMRFFVTPTPWVSGTYLAGNIVYWQNLAYSCTTNGTTTQPDQDPVGWNVLPTGVYWTWGTITQIINNHNVNVQIEGNPIQYAQPITIWRFGVYGGLNGYPTCGFFAQGRFWLGGAVPNRFDASMSNGFFKDGRLVFSPTGPGATNVTASLIDDGAVNDNNGIAYTLEADVKNPIYWFEHDNRSGLLVGTLGGEWKIDSSNGQDPITPLNIQCNKVTHYGCANVKPVRTGIALVFVQRFKRKIMEFLSDVFTGRYTAPHLSDTARDLTVPSVEELMYQEELTPIIWARVNPCAGEGNLIGATYRRVSAFTTEAPKFVGWHRHDLGTSRNVESISVGANHDGTIDALSMVTGDPLLETSNAQNPGGVPTAQVRWAEQLMPSFDQNDKLLDAWCLDGAIVPDSMYEDTVAGVTGQRLTGLWQYYGVSVTVFAGGLDLGEHTVDANGTIFIPYGSGVAPTNPNFCTSGSGAWQFTKAYINGIINSRLQLKYPVASTTVTTTQSTPTKTPGANPNVGNNKIQSYVPANAQGSADAYVCVDFGTGRLIVGEPAAAGVTSYNIATGVDTARGAAGTFSSTYLYSCSDQNGAFYHSTGPSNYGPLISVNDQTLAVNYTAGVSSTFGPPGNNGVVGGGHSDCMMAMKANAVWIFTMGSGTITLNQGSTGNFFGGNNSTKPQYEGLGAQPWTLQYGLNNATLAPGAATWSNNIASGYIANGQASYTTGGTYTYFVGIMDGVPTTATTQTNDGKKGKGKSKKGAGFADNPSTDSPIKLFYQIGVIHAADIDPLWQDNWGAGIADGGVIIDQYDNSMIMHATCQAFADSTWTAYSTSAIYNFNAASTKYPIANDTVTTANPHTAGTLVTDGTNAYVCILNSTPGILLTNATYFTQLTIVNKQAGQTYAIIGMSHTSGNQLYAVVQENVYNLAPNVAANQGCAHDTNPKPYMPIQMNYIVKYTTGQFSRQNTGGIGIAWAVPTNASKSNADMNKGRVTGGLYGWLSWTKEDDNGDGTHNYPIYLIDTTTGGWYAVKVGGFGVGGAPPNVNTQFWDDASESVFYWGPYDSTGTNAPIALNATVSVNPAMLRLYVGSSALPATNTMSAPSITSACANPLVQPVLAAPPTPYTFSFPPQIFYSGSWGECAINGGFPVIVGKTYTSQGQILRRVEPNDGSGSRLGPGFATTRRSHYWAGLLQGTIQMKYGVDFGASLTCATFKDGQDGNTGNLIIPGQSSLFSGFVRYPLKDGYSYDSMLSWQIDRPFPASVISVGGMLESNDV